MANSIENINRTQQSSEVKSICHKSEKHTVQKKDSRHSRQQDKSLLQLKKELKKEIKDMNKIVRTVEENLSFRLHDETDMLMVQIIDLRTDEVLKEMPPEEMLDLSARIHRMVGLILDEKV